MLAVLAAEPHLSWWVGLTRVELHDAIVIRQHLWQTSTKTRKMFLDFIGAQLLPPL